MDDHHFGYKQKFLKEKHRLSQRLWFFGGEFWHSSKKKKTFLKIHCKA
jgi:hypothetical protein